MTPNYWLRFVGTLLSILLVSGCTTSPHHDATYAADTAQVNRYIERLNRREIENPDSALKLARAAINISEKAGYAKGRARALFQMGVVYDRENHYDKALSAFDSARALGTAIGDTAIVAYSTERMGSVHLSTDDQHLAIKLYYNALLLFEKIGDSAGMAKVFNVLGSAKSSPGSFDTAEAYFTRAIGINERMGNTFDLWQNKANLAYMFQLRGDHGKAADLYRQLVDRYSALHDSGGLQVVYYDLASLHQVKKQYDSTLYYLDLALRIAIPLHDTSLQCTLYGNKGEVFLLTGRPDSAARNLNRSVDYARAIHDAETVVTAMEFLQMVDSTRGDYRGIARRNKEILALKDSVSHMKERNDREETELKYQKERVSYRLDLEQSRYKTALREKEMLLLAVIGLLLAGGLTGVILLQQRKNIRRRKQAVEHELLIKNLQVEAIRKDHEIDQLRLEKMEEEMKCKERELLAQTVAYEQQNEFLTGIGKRIREDLVDHPEVDPSVVVNGIVSAIRLQQGDKGESDLFSQQFSQVHDDFFDNLRLKHPGLTRTEVRFCAYLRLNISGNQIAKSLNITPEAIRKTRYRIRKKLNLRKEESLEDYLAGF